MIREENLQDWNVTTADKFFFKKTEKLHMFHPPQGGHHIPMFWTTEIQNPCSSLVQTCMFSGRALCGFFFFFWPSCDSRGSFPSTLLQKEGRKRETTKQKWFYLSLVMNHLSFYDIYLVSYVTCEKIRTFVLLPCTVYLILSSQVDPTILKTIHFLISTARSFSRGLPLFSVWDIEMKWNGK